MRKVICASTTVLVQFGQRKMQFRSSYDTNCIQIIRAADMLNAKCSKQSGRTVCKFHFPFEWICWRYMHTYLCLSVCLPLSLSVHIACFFCTHQLIYEHVCCPYCEIYIYPVHTYMKRSQTKKNLTLLPPSPPKDIGLSPEAVVSRCRVHVLPDPGKLTSVVEGRGLKENVPAPGKGQGQEGVSSRVCFLHVLCWTIVLKYGTAGAATTSGTSTGNNGDYEISLGHIVWH